jgi:hypothetical protein
MEDLPTLGARAKTSGFIRRASPKQPTRSHSSGPAPNNAAGVCRRSHRRGTASVLAIVAAAVELINHAI